ncbi:hypothetical protein [Streptomyces meridianus]|uniref:Antitoxin n=1 Tax=Streptomyces meridianus TaxID=2938945 RepID=A0ABT0X0K8_9ACTN|nr:hypothetical protein [Streptomyces meridianus]MCM2576102.1 hypothetical protein [Streptomyces meridianus]
MAKLLDRAKEGTQRGLTRSKQKLDDVQAQRAGQELLRKLGTAYYKEQRGGGSSQDTQDALNAVTAHITDHGDAFLEHSRNH